MEKDLFQGLQHPDFDGGQELEREPEVSHDVAWLGDLGRGGRVGPNEAASEEAEDEFLDWDQVGGGVGFGELGLEGVPHGVQVGGECWDPDCGASF